MTATACGPVTKVPAHRRRSRAARAKMRASASARSAGQTSAVRAWKPSAGGRRARGSRGGERGGGGGAEAAAESDPHAQDRLVDHAGLGGGGVGEAGGADGGAGPGQLRVVGAGGARGGEEAAHERAQVGLADHDGPLELPT